MVLICWLITALHILIYKEELHLHIVLRRCLRYGWVSFHVETQEMLMPPVLLVLPLSYLVMLPLANLFVIGEKEKKLDY